MKHNVTISLLLILAFCTPTIHAEESPGAPETNGEFTAKMPIKLSRTMVAYCVVAMPELKDNLEQELSSFDEKFEEAIKPAMERLASDPGFSAPVTPETREQFEQINERMLAEVKKADPNVYCPGILKRMHNATVEELRSSVDAALAQYQSTSK